jgi:hypothetical protein
MYLIDTPWADKRRVKWIAEYTPQVHWAQGGPIIERERINTLDNGGDFSCYYSRGAAVGIRYTGPTPLIAAMRCYVISKLGEEVEVLDELMEN